MMSSICIFLCTFQIFREIFAPENGSIESVRFHKSTGDIKFNEPETTIQDSNFDAESRFSTSTAFLGMGS